MSHTVKTNEKQISFNALSGVDQELKSVFGDPLRRTGGILKGEVWLNAQFTKPAMLKALKTRYPLVHIASHFSFEPGSESSSFLLLGDGKTMTLAEMKKVPDLFQGVELLTLSACNTGAQLPGADGSEMDGFSELAQRLGARAVMASLWEVADSSTAQLMTEFYRRRESGKLTKAEALQRAQLALLRGEIQERKDVAGSQRDSKVVGETGSGQPFKRDPQRPYAHPYYWAPFILIGNWR